MMCVMSNGIMLGCVSMYTCVPFLDSFISSFYLSKIPSESGVYDLVGCERVELFNNGDLDIT